MTNTLFSPFQVLKSRDLETQAQEWEESKQIKYGTVQSQHTFIAHLAVSGTRQIHIRHIWTENLPPSAQLKLCVAWMAPSFAHEMDVFSKVRAVAFTGGLEASLILSLRVSIREKGSLGQARREVMTFAQTWFLEPLLPIFC